jgi:uncharacterized Fe-S cluster protein YjdI
MMETVKKYSNDDITIVWKPDLCIHSTLCWKGLINVFNPDKRPWIDPYGATTEKIIDQVEKCPSGALSYYKKGEENKQNENSQESVIIEVIKDGPLMIHGNVTLKDAEGNISQKNKVCALCRCGASNKKPYCDGAHISINFKD